MIGGILGLMLPNIVLDHLVENRQKRLRDAFPDALDLLVVCVEAGLGLTAAIQRVADELHFSHPELAAEFALVTAEMRAGVDRETALKGLAARTGLDDIRGLVSLLIQTLRFGTSIADTLRVYSEEFRDKRMQRAEEQAAKIGTKLIFPLVFCLFPVVLRRRHRAGGHALRGRIPRSSGQEEHLRHRVAMFTCSPLLVSGARRSVPAHAAQAPTPPMQHRRRQGRREPALCGATGGRACDRVSSRSAAEGVQRGDEAWRQGKLDLAVYLYVQSLAYDATARSVPEDRHHPRTAGQPALAAKGIRACTRARGRTMPPPRAARPAVPCSRGATRKPCFSSAR